MKTFTKHILLLALMLFGVAGAAWALPRAPQKFTGPVDMADLVVGDTLAEGFSLTGDDYAFFNFKAQRAKVNGEPLVYLTGFVRYLIDGYGPNCAVNAEQNVYTPVLEDQTTDGNAWVVTDVEPGGQLNVTVAGIRVAPDPYAPALDETTGHWNFLMPGSNKVVKAVLYDSIVLGPHVELYDAEPAFAAGDIYTRGDSTIYYYDTNNHHSFYLRADEQADGKYFGFWSDLDPTDDYYTDRTYRRVSTGSFTCGQRFTAAYLENHTLTLNPSAGGTLSLDGEIPGETTYNITIGDGNTNTNVTFPFQTMVFLQEGLDEVYNEGLSPLSIDQQLGNYVVITISEPYDGGRTIQYSCGGGEGGAKTIFCTAVQGDPIMPYGISKTGDNTYSVMEGLTVNVTATPDAAHYLKNFSGGADTNSNTAVENTFVVTADTILTANFAPKPTLTLAHNQGGEMEIPIGLVATDPTPAPTPTAVANPVITGVLMPDGSMQVTMSCTTQDADIYYTTDNVTSPTCDCPAAPEYTHPITFTEPVTIKAAAYTGNDWSAVVTKTITLGLPAGVAQLTDTTYCVDYGTDVTVKATPSDTAYLVRFDNDDALNRNTDTTKIYTNITEDFVARATFNAKPVLTLAQNESWGSVTVEGAGSAGGAGGDVTIGDSTSTSVNTSIPSYSLYQYSYIQEIYTASEIGTAGTIQSLTMWLKNTSSYTRNIEIYMKEIEESTFADNTSWVSLSDGDLVATGTIVNEVENPTATTYTLDTPFEYSGNGNLLLCIRDITGNWSSGVRGTVTAVDGNQAIYAARDGNAYDISNPGTGDVYGLLQEKNVVKFHIGAAGSGLPAGVAQLTDTTYRVDYGTTLTLQADATELHHVQAWLDQNADTMAAAQYGDYFVTEPENLFPKNSTLTFTMTQDTVATAMFGINSYDVTAMMAAGQAERGTVKALYTDIQGAAQTAMNDTVEATAQGGSTTTLVAFPANSCFDFAYWQVGSEQIEKDTLTVTAATQAVAYFVYHQYTGDTTVDVCDRYTWHGLIYSTVPEMAPTYIYKTAQDECDSTVTLHLTLRYATTGDTTASECDQFSWFEHTGLTASTEELQHVFVNAVGCDSIVTLHLTIRYSNTGVETATACDQYEWQGSIYTESNTTDQRTLVNKDECDSVVTLNLTVNYHHDTTVYWQTSGDFVWGRGTTYQETFVENGTYNRTIDTKQGCDSNVTIVLAYLPHTTPLPTIYNIMGVSLFINHFPEGTDKIDYIYYRWYKNGEVVSEGEGVDSYSEDGDMLNGCFYLEISTEPTLTYWAQSNEVCLGNVGIDDVKNITMTLAPNPVVRGQQVNVTISESNLQGAVATVYDAQGRQVSNFEVRNSTFEIQTSNLTAGIYTVRIVLSDGRMATKKVVVK